MGMRDEEQDREGNFDAGGGLPAHLEVNPSDLFWKPDDRVLSAAEDDHESLGPGEFAAEDDGHDWDAMPSFDLDLADKPTTCGKTEIHYSRNSKFVDVKLV